MSDQLATIEQTDLVTIDGQRPDQHPAAVYLAGLSKSSRRSTIRALNSICGAAGMADPNLDDEGEPLAPRDGRRVDDRRYLAFPWHELRFQHVQAIRAELQENYSYRTVNKMLSAMRGVLKAAWKLGLIPAEQYHKATSVENVKGETVPAGRHIPAGEVSALLDTCEQTATGIRDAAIISILYACGLRRAEVVALDLGDYDQAENRLLVRGKGNKERLVPVVNGAANALADWLEVRGDVAGPLFWGTGNRNRHKRLTTQAIYFMLQTRAERAGIDNLSPHDFRRTFVGELLDAGADIATVQKLAGHANVETTARYDRRGEKAKRRAAELLHVPYRRRTLAPAGE